MSARVLVAGAGNIFLGDDGFGSEVVRRLGREPWPDGVRVRDFGVAAVHLAYELEDGFDTVVLVDASARGLAPGTLSVIEPELDPAPVDEAEFLFDPHGVTPDTALALLARVGDRVGRVLVVACEPASTDEGIGLSPPVAGAVDEAVSLVRRLVEEGVGARTRAV
ncbi:MAG: hydrogenase maturation protease [Acidimicrobiia bacterium]|nr:hydrogenase maturation protease [Acidimicrobiia bacterium]